MYFTFTRSRKKPVAHYDECRGSSIGSEIIIGGDCGLKAEIIGRWTAAAKCRCWDDDDEIPWLCALLPTVLVIIFLQTRNSYHLRRCKD